MSDSRHASFFGSVLGGALGVLALSLCPAVAHAAPTLSGDAAAAFEISTFIEGVDGATDIAVLPDGRAVVTQRAGDVTTKPVTGEPITAHIDVDSSHNERGLLGVVADPAFATNQYLYFYASSGANADSRHQILRYKLGADSKLTDKMVLVDGNLKGPANHNGGGIDIYQGNLYIGVGDTGANASPPTNHFGSCLDRANGKVLRVSAATGQPPADNPLMKQDMVTGCDSTGGDFHMAPPEKRIWAWGFRNPFRVWVDKTTGNVWVGDVGETTREEVTVAKMGKHHGYPFVEGTKTWGAVGGLKTCTDVTPSSECIAPVHDYGHDVGQCIIGGRILDGCGWPAAFKNRYIFGDHEAKKVWTVQVNATRDGVMGGQTEFASDVNGLSSIRMGTDNALYFMQENVGAVLRVVAKGVAATANSCPAVNADPSVPAGGAGQGGAAAGGGGAGGASNPTGGASNPTGGASNPTGGASNPTAGSTSNPTAGSTSNPSAGASNGTAGSSPGAGGASAAGTGNKDSGDDGGCGCRVAGAPAASALGLSGLALALGAALQRRRRRGSRQK